MIRVALGLVLAILASGAPDAVADVLCAARSGKLAVRSACRRRERVVDAHAIGLVGPSGPPGQMGAAGPDAAPGGHPFRVVDGLDRPFGLLVSFDGLRARTVVTLADGPVQFVVIGGAIRTSEISAFLYYQQADCAGTPFVRAGGGIVPVVQVFGSVGYYSRSNSELLSVASEEYELAPGADTCPPGSAATSRGTCCLDASTMAYMSPATTVAVSSLGVTPPFTVRP